MKPPTEYTVMGEDGKDYGPVFDEQIRDWIKEGRLGPKTPVRTTRDKDWVFLADVPEFAKFFPLPPVVAPPSPPRKGLVRFFYVLLVLTVLFYLFNYLLGVRHH